MRVVRMDTFIGRDCFSGASAGAPGPLLSQARFSGCIAFTNWPRAEVERLLPNDLQLAVNRRPTLGFHPVIFIFGELTDGASIFGGFTIPLGVRYGEVCVAIPFVTQAGGRYLYTYIPRMYSTYLPATWIGNAQFGLAKKMAKMWWQDQVFMLTAEEGALLMHAAVETDCDWMSGAHCELPNFRAMREVFSLPVLGRKEGGQCVRSHFDWDFSDALVRAADSCVSIDAPLIDGLTVCRCHDVAAGTFEVRGMLWRLSWPVIL